MSDRNEAIKNHFAKHKTKYYVALASGTCLIVGAACHAALLSQADGSSNNSVTVHPISFLMRDVVTTVHTGNHGHPGFRTRNLETGAEYSTQAEAARAFDINPSNLSAHLNGKYENAEGLHFERIAA